MFAIFSQLVGLNISLIQLGIAVSQGYWYYRTFPRDKRSLKSLVVIILIMTTASTVLSCIMYWSLLTGCFRSDFPTCLSWAKVVSMMSINPTQLHLRQSMALLLLPFTIPFVVQSFYCHRVWIISDRNIYVTMPIIFFAASSYGLGLALIPSQALGTFSSDTALKLASWRAFLSVMCDCMISMSVYFYLGPLRSGVKRMDTRIQNITENFISMGILSCLLAIFTCILYWANQYAAIGGVAMILRNSYANSLLAILNARKPFRTSQDGYRTSNDTGTHFDVKAAARATLGVQIVELRC